MTSSHGGHERSQGRKCRACKQTEARCAFRAGCCVSCSHWTGWTADGEPIATTGAAGGRPLVPVDEVTAKRREQWRRQYATRRVS